MQEVNSMKALRKKNREKLISDQSEDARFCVCQKPKDGFMIRCELCLEWFHPTCVPLPRIPVDDPIVETVTDGIDSQAVIAFKIACRETKYLGPCCSRSRRPEYNIILELLIGLNKIPLHMVEGVALQCLTNRAMKWQEEVDKLYDQIPELGDLRDLVEEKSTTVVIAPYKKPSEADTDPVPPLQKRFFYPSLTPLSNGVKSSPSALEDVVLSNPTAAHSAERVSEVDVAMTLIGMGGGQSFEPPKISVNQAQESNGSAQDYDHNGQSEEWTITKVEGNVGPKITLSPDVLEEVENLMIEADLMEVTAYQSDFLWKIYDMANPTVVETRDLTVRS